MRTFNLNLKNWLKIMIPVFALFAIVACGDDDDGGTTPMSTLPTASFSVEVDANDFLSVTTTNVSQNATTYAWDFGDGSGTSTEFEPTYTYAAAGTYTITLTASNAAGESDDITREVVLTNPNSALTLLTGTDPAGKTWKLFREGTSISVGPTADQPTDFFGLTNDGGRPCLYRQEFTFSPDGSYIFNDAGEMWSEFGTFNNVPDCPDAMGEGCFEAIPENMVNSCGDDVSAWLSGTHTFTYDPSTTEGQLTLNGLGAQIGIPKLGTNGEVLTPQNSVTPTRVTITEENGYDLMFVEFDYVPAMTGVYFSFVYVSYDNPADEPELVTAGPPPFGVDLPNTTPMGLFNDFNGAGSIDTIPAASTVEYGVTDPAGSAETVGQFNRTGAEFQELQFQTSPEKFDIDWDNITTVSVDVYFPSTNDYTGTLTKNVIIGLADFSNTQQWFTDQQEYHDFADHAEDEWITFTFNLDSPDFVAKPDNGATPYERDDYDMMYIQLGSGGHFAPGTFFVRNLVFE